MRRWARRARTAARFEPGEHRGLLVRLPLEHATAVIESVSAQGELVGVRLYGHPWVWGEVVFPRLVSGWRGRRR